MLAKHVLFGVAAGLAVLLAPSVPVWAYGGGAGGNTLGNVTELSPHSIQSMGSVSCIQSRPPWAWITLHYHYPYASSGSSRTNSFPVLASDFTACPVPNPGFFWRAYKPQAPSLGHKLIVPLGCAVHPTYSALVTVRPNTLEEFADYPSAATLVQRIKNYYQTVDPTVQYTIGSIHANYSTVYTMTSWVQPPTNTSVSQIANKMTTCSRCFPSPSYLAPASSIREAAKRQYLQDSLGNSTTPFTSIPNLFPSDPFPAHPWTSGQYDELLHTYAHPTLPGIWTASFLNGPESLSAYYSRGAIAGSTPTCHSSIVPICHAPSSKTVVTSGPFLPSGCAGPGKVRGTITTTTTQTRYTCPGPTAQTQSTSTTQTATRSSTTNCQTTSVPLACVADKPGYAYVKTCLLFNGAPTHCTAPHVQYDPAACPVPVPAN